MQNSVASLNSRIFPPKILG